MFLTLARCGAHTSNPIRIFLQRKVSHKQTGAIFHHLAKLQIHPIFMIHQGIFGVENSNKGNYPMTSLEFTQILVISKKKKRFREHERHELPHLSWTVRKFIFPNLKKPWKHSTFSLQKTNKQVFFFQTSERSSSLKGFPFRNYKIIYIDRCTTMLMVQKSGQPVEGKVVYPMICKVLAPSQVVVWDFFHQQYDVVECSPTSTVTSDLIRPAANAAVSRAHRGGLPGRALQDVAMWELKWPGKLIVIFIPRTSPNENQS